MTAPTPSPDLTARLEAALPCAGWEECGPDPAWHAVNCPAIHRAALARELAPLLAEQAERLPADSERAGLPPLHEEREHDVLCCCGDHLRPTGVTACELLETVPVFDDPEVSRVLAAADFRSAPLPPAATAAIGQIAERWEHIIAQVVRLTEDGVISGGRAAEVLGVDLLTWRTLASTANPTDAAALLAEAELRPESLESQLAALVREQAAELARLAASEAGLRAALWSRWATDTNEGRDSCPMCHEPDGRATGNEHTRACVYAALTAPPSAQLASLRELREALLDLLAASDDVSSVDDFFAAQGRARAALAGTGWLAGEGAE